MEDLRLIAELDTACTPSVGRILGQLRQEVAELRGEATQLRRENLELRQQAGYWKGQHAQAVKRIEQLQHEAEHLRSENRPLQSQAFGRKTEKEARQDRSKVLEGEDEPPAEPKPHGQRRARSATPRLCALAGAGKSPRTARGRTTLSALRPAVNAVWQRRLRTT
jgi:FtsZ-binding cell division protein ZapB